MKIKVLLLFLFIIFSCVGVETNFIKNYLNKNIFKASVKGTIVAKIDNNPISLMDIRDEMKNSLSFDYSNKQTEMLMNEEIIQKNYEEKVINQYLILKNIINDDILNSKEFESYFKSQLKEILIKFYIHKEFFNNKDNTKWKEIMITSDDEVQNFYNENKKIFDSKNINKDDALIAIRSDIEKRKSSLFLMELTNFQNNLIEGLKTKYNVQRINH